MKNLIKRTRFAIYILLCVVLAQSCKNETVKTTKTYELTKEQLIVIWTNGYLNGNISGLKGVDTFKQDSIAFCVRWQE